MSFNLDLLKNQLGKYGTITDCKIYHNTDLEIKVENISETHSTFERIENEFILPYFNKIESSVVNTYYKAGFIIKNNIL